MAKLITSMVIVMFLLIGCLPPPHTTGSREQFNAALKIKRIAITPSTVKRGQDIRITIRYIVRHGPESGTVVKEQISILRKNKVISVIRTSENIVQNGAWENFLTIGIPKSLAKGTYELKVHFSTPHSDAQSTAQLVVK